MNEEIIPQGVDQAYGESSIQILEGLEAVRKRGRQLYRRGPGGSL